MVAFNLSSRLFGLSELFLCGCSAPLTLPENEHWLDSTGYPGQKRRMQTPHLKPLATLVTVFLLTMATILPAREWSPPSPDLRGYPDRP